MGGRRIHSNYASINKLAKFKSETNYNLRSTMAFCLPKPRTNSLKHTSLYRSLKKWMDLETKINLSLRSFRKNFYKFIILSSIPQILLKLIQYFELIF